MAEATLHAAPAATGTAGLVLDVPPYLGDVVPDGAYVADHLDQPARRAVEAAAHAALAAWRAHFDVALTVDGISLADIWHAELFTDVFLPVVHAEHGARAAARATGVDVLRADDLDAELAAALRAALAPDGIEVTGGTGPPQAYPTEDMVPPVWAIRKPLWQAAARGAVDALGVPTWARGGVIGLNYGPVAPVIERLAAAGRRPPLYLPAPPAPGAAVRLLARGGVIGLPGARRRRAAIAGARRALRAAAELGPPEVLGPLGGVLTARSLRLIEAMGLATTAPVPALERALSRRQIGGLLLPFDAEPAPRLLVRLARRHGVPSLAIQHGYEPFAEPFRPGTLSERVAAWSEGHRQTFPADRRADVTVTGNPGAAAPEPAGARPRGRPVVVVLVEHKPRTMCTVDRRVAARHLRTALEGLSLSGLDLDIVVRPHPADLPEHYDAMAKRAGVEARVVSEGPLRPLLASAHLCVAATSTGALETALVGLPMIMLDVFEVPIHWPLDGSGGVLRATTAAELAELVPVALAAAEPPGRDTLLEALGATVDDPAGRVMALLDGSLVWP